MPTKDIVVVGTSSGGIEALQTLVAGLPRDFAAAMFIVHQSSCAGRSSSHPRSREPLACELSGR